jgi:hypothetical protein
VSRAEEFNLEGTQLKKALAVISVVAAFAASAALATAQNESSRGDGVEPVAVEVPYKEVIIPESLEGRDEAFKKAVEQDRAEAPRGTKPGPVIDPDQVHVPEGPVEDVFVRHCAGVVKSGSLDREPLCQVVLLMDAGRIKAGVYAEKQVSAQYERFAELRGVAK